MILFDLESNGLLDTLDTIHCLVTLDTDTGEVKRFRGSDIETTGLPYLSQHPSIGGHNIIKFDLPALQKVFGWRYFGKVFDTLVMTRLLFADVGDSDLKLFKRKKFPGKLIGSHSLKAWGYRLGVLKGSYASEAGDGCWDFWSEAMEDYCEQDVRVTYALFTKIQADEYPTLAEWIEHEFCKIIQRQESRGVCFDEDAAARLWSLLAQRKAEVEQELKSVFGSWQELDKEFIPKRDNKRLGYKAGVLVKKYKTVEFNPGSRKHIARVLMDRHGWTPVYFTDSKQVKVDEKVISKLSYPECPKILEYLVLSKRLGQLAEGAQAWLKNVRSGRIHGSVNTGGAVTGRCTHSNPNLAQVPAGNALYGRECRSLFTASPGYMLVGCDASGLELRCLAHYMARWDKGEYAQEILSGDIHTKNQNAAGLPSRDHAKTMIYGYLYGAGDGKLGEIIKGSEQAGARLRRNLQTNIPALGKLTDAVKSVTKSRGWLRGIDGRKLHVRHRHAALNTLLQSAGAIAMKLALIISDWYLQSEGLVPLGLGGSDYEFVLNIHDEYQVETLPQHAQAVGEALALAIAAAGAYLGFRCPLAGKFKEGKNWAETH